MTNITEFYEEIRILLRKSLGVQFSDTRTEVLIIVMARIFSRCDNKQISIKYCYELRILDTLYTVVL